MKPINVQIKGNIADFLKTRSLYVIRVLRAAESVRDRQKILARDRLQTYSTLDGFAIAVYERLHSERAFRPVVMQRELHYQMESSSLPCTASPPPLPRERDSFDARNCAVARETERIATILLHGTKTRQITFTKLPIETGHSLQRAQRVPL